MNNISCTTIRTGWIAPIVLIAISTFIVTGHTQAQETRDGQIRTVDSYEVWSKALNKWVTPMKFWTTFATMNGGLTWGVRQDYPEYSKVKERDLMIIELRSGSCLMEFFHRRWRRANDVRRWDTQFNEVGGCPHVFD